MPFSFLMNIFNFLDDRKWHFTQRNFLEQTWSKYRLVNVYLLDKRVFMCLNWAVRFDHHKHMMHSYSDEKWLQLSHFFQKLIKLCIDIDIYNFFQEWMWTDVVHHLSTFFLNLKISQLEGKWPVTKSGWFSDW